jgi:TIR domain/SIR2-like domain
MKLFICYAHENSEDKIRLEKIFNALGRSDKSLGLEVESDEHIAPGITWHAEIMKQLASADLIVPLISREFFASDYITTHEVSAALDRNSDNLFPILLYPIPQGTVSPLKNRQWYGAPGGIAIPLLGVTKHEVINPLHDAILDRLKKISGTLRQHDPAIEIDTQEGFVDRTAVSNAQTFFERRYSLMRCIFSHDSGGRYKVAIEHRQFGQLHFERKWANCLTFKNPGFDQTLLRNVNVARALDAAHAAAIKHDVPVRMQLCFDRSARDLALLPWEGMKWKGQKVSANPKIVLSRQMIVGNDHDLPEIRIASKRSKKIEPAQVAEVGKEENAVPKPEPTSEWEQHIDEESDEKLNSAYLRVTSYPPMLATNMTWAPDGLASSDIGKEFSAYVDVCTPSAMTPSPSDMDTVVAEHDLVYLSFPVAFSDVDPATTQASLVVNDIARTRDWSDIAELICPRHKTPIVLIVAPNGWDGDTPGQVFDAFAGLAADLANRGVPAVVVPSECLPYRAWELFVVELAKGLKRHGIIDVAVSDATRRVHGVEGRVQLYLRSKSARLWYRAGFRSVGIASASAPGQFPWADVRSAIDARGAQACTVIVGPHISRDLNLGRRQIAKDIADAHGFALSERERENLARVCEYVRVSASLVAGNSVSLKEAGGARSIPTHVRAFLKYSAAHVKGLCRDANIATGPEGQMTDAQILQTLSWELAQKKGESARIYSKLADVKTACFVTASFHNVLEKMLVTKQRTPRTGDLSGEFSEEGTSVDDAVSASLNTPLVFRPFGGFHDPHKIILAESDHLRFMVEFLRSMERFVAWVRGRLVDSNVLIVGFHPASWEFRVIYAALQLIEGSYSRANFVHVAVQVDPEDDLTIDPDGARSYYEGLFAEFGSTVFVYWGGADQFLAELENGCPELFIKREDHEPVPAS